MKLLRRITIILLLMISFFIIFSFPKTTAFELVPIPRASGNGYVTYRGQSIQVKMPTEYVESETNFRAVWVSPLVGDIGSYSTENSYKTQVYEIFDVMEYYNMNAMIFHLRIFNDALYNSKLNPISGYMNRADFKRWDPITWVIEECHKRGIEFHAWLNPYRVSSSTTALPLEEYAKRFSVYNIASDPSCLLKGNGIILNPGEPRVRAFLINTCMEIIENYNVDAIHFDDYFYISGIDDAATRSKYNYEGLSVADFRRKQVDLFIEALSNRIRNYNQQNNRLVQLGISPTGIYRNGYYVETANYDDNGNMTAPYGSNTAGYSHYDSPLCSDTKKWVDNEWIDYIVPQSYWAIEHGVAGYADVMDWWVKALKYKKVNLYSGMGLYMASDSANSSWYSNPREAANQVQYASQYQEIKGHVIFSYSQVKSAYKSKSGRYYQNMENIKNEMWRRPSVLPEIRNCDTITLPAVKNLNVSKTLVGYRLDFSVINNAKFYVIYRGVDNLRFSSSEVIDVIGDVSDNGIISYIDEVDTGNHYVYGIKAMSLTNSLGTGRTVTTQGAPLGELLDIGEIKDIAIPEVANFNTTVQIRWPSLPQLLGGPITYSVYKSFDNASWEPVTSYDNPITTTGSVNTQKVRLDKNNSLVYFRIDANNRTGKSTTYFNLNVYHQPGYIRNFAATGEIYAGKTINFKWTKMNIEGVTYKVQYSPDGYYWTDITNDDNPTVDTGISCLQPFTLPQGSSYFYYRVIATAPSGKTASSPIRLEVYEKIGDFQIRVNGDDYLEPVIVKQDEPVHITWMKHTFSDGEVQYRTMISTDMNYWMSYKIHNYKNNLTCEGDYWIQTINPDFRYYTLYVRVEAISSSGRNYSPIIELRVEMNDLVLTQLIDYIVNAPNCYLNKTNIYRK
ncbi:MAG: family 10 glycosylhydrolase [Bacilli bacterium]|nr:family 10 glycosylhydrolase [Bacilli bacterium]